MSDPKYPQQFSWVGNDLQYDLLKEATQATGLSKGIIVRAAFNALFGLGSNDQLMPGDTQEAALERAKARLAALSPAVVPMGDERQA